MLNNAEKFVNVLKNAKCVTRWFK